MQMWGSRGKIAVTQGSSARVMSMLWAGQPPGLKGARGLCGGSFPPPIQAKYQSPQGGQGPGGEVEDQV